MSRFLKNKRRLALISIQLCVIGFICFFSLTAGAICLLIFLGYYTLAIKIYNLHWYYIQHPAIVNLKRDYESAVFGSTSCYRLGRKSTTQLNWALPDMSIDELWQILLRYYSLVKEGGVITLHVKENELKSRKTFHPFVYTVLHQWSFSERGTDEPLKLLIKDFCWTNSLFFPVALGKQYEEEDIAYDVIEKMRIFLNERNREFIVECDNKLCESLNRRFCNITTKEIK